VVHGLFYVDDGLTGSDDVVSAIGIQRELQAHPRVLQTIFLDLREENEIHPISDLEAGHTKTLGLEWNNANSSIMKL